MLSIDEIIQREVNPFDSTTFKPGNFWQEQQNPTLTVNTIHQEAITQIEQTLNLIAKDHRTRSLMLLGDSGSGKSHLLGRLKQSFNSKAYFAYIGPWADSNYIWRHILRQTVDSLLKIPEGRQESQLLLWLKSLSVFQQRSIIDRILGDRKVFIRKLRETYPTDIYNANEFFGILYDLLNPEIRVLACDWLRGDDLDEDELKALRVKSAIDNEDTAQNILANIGKISAKTQPIVLCFDQLDNIPHLADGTIDLQALFSVNSTILNQSLKNFLIIISVITNTWKLNSQRIIPADRARIDASISLKPINLEQAEAIWKLQLQPLHQQADNPPDSPIYPLPNQVLLEKFPGGKTYPRNTLILGRQLFQDYKEKLIKDEKIILRHSSVESKLELAAFKLVWNKELEKNQEKISRIRQFSAPELMQMLREALEALEVQSIQPKFLPSSSYASYSLSYQLNTETVGLVWTEDPSMASFFHIMKSCQKTITQNKCNQLFLIRAERLGSSDNQGYKYYQQIFTNSSHRHFQPDLNCIHYLATYHSLVNAVCSKELVIAEQTPNLQELKTIVRESQILHDCRLLQNLKIVPHKDTHKKNNLQPVSEFLLSLVTTQQFLGRKTLMQNAISRFAQVQESQVEQLIQQLCQANKVQILDPNAKPEAQLICLVPSSSK